MREETDAAVLFEVAQPPRVVRLGLPPLAPGQVQVDVAWSGVCHTQLAEVRGRRGPDRFLPHTLGHEGAGTVVAVGEGVRTVAPGDRVVLSWIKGAGAQVPACIYESAAGPVNSGAVSTFLRRAVVSENRVTRIPAAMPLREAALLGCAVPTGAGIVLNVARVAAGESVAVFGAGGIGTAAIMAARLAGAAPLIAVDVVARKLVEAHALGATHTVDASAEDPARAIAALTGGRGVDHAIECAGRRASMEAAVEATREGGGLCVLAGNLAHGERITIDPWALIRGRRVVGTWGGGTDPARDIPRWAEAHLAGTLDLGRLVTHEYRLAAVARALDDLEAGRVGRVLLDLGA
jgi:S-(hydroxymethyl)glutathione dehydrogenase/alcohol dehydrogenase